MRLSQRWPIISKVWTLVLRLWQKKIQWLAEKKMSSDVTDFSWKPSLIFYFISSFTSSSPSLHGSCCQLARGSPSCLPLYSSTAPSFLASAALGLSFMWDHVVEHRHLSGQSVDSLALPGVPVVCSRHLWVQRTLMSSLYFKTNANKLLDLKILPPESCNLTDRECGCVVKGKRRNQQTVAALVATGDYWQIDWQLS